MFLLAVLAALFLPSCAERYKDIKVTGVRLESLRPSSLRSVDAVLLVDVDNPLRSKVKVKKMMGAVFQNSKQIATLTSDDEVELAPRCVSTNRIKVRATVDNAMFFFEQFQKGARPNYKEFTVDFSAVAGSGLFQFPMEKKNMPVEELVRQARAVWKK
ncbi:MAG: hypothetical protein J6Y40_02455 [Bacteroidales bacterium]|nr:hypothetical protein [Bacteroidales bacterium]